MLRLFLLTVSGVLATTVLCGCTTSSPRGEGHRADRTSAYLEVREPAAQRCTGRLGATEVDGDLVVPPEHTCRLEGTAVGGRVNVTSGASLVATDARFGEGISAHGFRRVELLDGHAPGRPRAWSFLPPASSESDVDVVLDGGGDVVIEAGPGDGHFYIVGNSGRVRIEHLVLDTGEVFCARNRHRPFVRGVTGETPGKLQGQCAGLGHFAPGSDF